MLSYPHSEVRGYDPKGPPTAQKGSRLWSPTHDAGLTGTQNPTSIESWRLLPRFQRSERLSDVRQGALLRAMDEDVKVQPRLQWRFWDIGDAGTVECLLKKATHGANRKAVLFGNGKTIIRIGLRKSAGARVTAHAPDVSHGTTGFSVCCCTFSSSGCLLAVPFLPRGTGSLGLGL